MQVKLIKDCWGPNPKFDRTKPVSPENSPERLVPKGTILDHPDAYFHCRGDDPNAEPHDGEAKQNHAEYLRWRAKVLAERNVLPDGLDEADSDHDDEAEPPATSPLKPIAPLAPVGEAVAAAS